MIAAHYALVSDAAGRPIYCGLLLFKMLLAGIWNGGLSDESVEDMANSNLHVMRFLGGYRWKMMCRVILCYRDL